MFFKDKKWYHLRNIRIDLEVSLDFVTEKDFSPNFYGSLKFNLTVYISSQFPNTLLGNKLLRMKYFCSRNQMIILLRFVLPSDWSTNKNDRYFQEPSHFWHDILFLSIWRSIFIQTKFNFGMDSRLYFDHVVQNRIIRCRIHYLIIEFVDDMMFYKLNTYCRYGPRTNISPGIHGPRGPILRFGDPCISQKPREENIILYRKSVLALKGRSTFCKG